MKQLLIHSSSLDQPTLSTSTHLSQNAESTLESTLQVMNELVHWMVKSGIGYAEFSAALRSLFYNEAIKELEYLNQKKTDSSVSLLSGLNRRDVSALRAENGGDHQIIPAAYVDILSSSVPARVVALWIHQDLNNILPISGEENSFEYLVKQISTEKHPRSILLELKRIGVIVEDGENVILQTNSFTPSPEMDEIKQLFTANIVSHLAAGIHNIIEKDDSFLEQALFANELTSASVELLKQTSMKLWNEMSKQVLAEALEYCKQDEGRKDAVFNFRLGVFQHDAQEKK